MKLSKSLPICASLFLLFLTVAATLFLNYVTDDASADTKHHLKRGEVITLHIGKPTQVPTKRKNRNAIFTYTGKLRNYYTIDYQSCDGRAGTGMLAFCAPHKIAFKDDLMEIDIYLFKIMPCVDGCSTLLSLEFIQYK